MSSLAQIAADYRTNNAVMEARIAELKARLVSEKPGCTEALLLRRKINALGEVLRDNRSVAVHLENYHKPTKHNPAQFLTMNRGRRENYDIVLATVPGPEAIPESFG